MRLHNCAKRINNIPVCGTFSMKINSMKLFHSVGDDEITESIIECLIDQKKFSFHFIMIQMIL